MTGFITGIGITLAGYYCIKDPQYYIGWKSNIKTKKGLPPFTEEERVKLARASKRMGILFLVCGAIVTVISFFELIGMV